VRKHLSGKPLFAVALLAVGLSAPRGAAAQSINTQSPFVSPGASAAATPTQNAPLELRGMVATKHGNLFAIFDPTKRQSLWVGLNEQGSDFVVRNYDANNEMITVDYQGRTLTLPMKASKVESLGPLPNPAQVNVMNRPGQIRPANAMVSAADEARRLESVAAEVRRRRMMRQAAQAGLPPAGVPGAPGQVPVPPR
jgi:hypothetical protein